MLTQDCQPHFHSSDEPMCFERALIRASCLWAPQETISERDRDRVVKGLETGVSWVGAERSLDHSLTEDFMKTPGPHSHSTYYKAASGLPPWIYLFPSSEQRVKTYETEGARADQAWKKATEAKCGWNQQEAVGWPADHVQLTVL